MSSSTFELLKAGLWFFCMPVLMACLYFLACSEDAGQPAALTSMGTLRW